MQALIACSYTSPFPALALLAANASHLGLHQVVVLPLSARKAQNAKSGVLSERIACLIPGTL